MAEDTKDKKYNTLVYSYSLYGTLELWNNRYLGLQEYYKNCKESETHQNQNFHK